MKNKKRSMSPTKLQVAFWGALVLGAALLISNLGPSEAASGLKNLKDRQPAPDFLLIDSRETQIKLSDYRGKVVPLNSGRHGADPARRRSRDLWNSRASTTAQASPCSVSRWMTIAGNQCGLSWCRRK